MPTLVACTGFEFGQFSTAAGALTTGNSGNKLFDSAAGTIGTNVIIEAASAFTGSFGLRLLASAAIVNLQWLTGTLGTSKDALVVSLRVKPITSAGAIVLLIGPNVSVNNAYLKYDTSTSKFSVNWQGQGNTNQAGTAAANAWHLIEIKASGFTGTTWHLDWRVDGVDQTSPADLTGQTADSLGGLILGALTSQTLEAAYDDIVCSTTVADWPLDGHKVQPLSVDTAGTITLGGGAVAADFNTFTANGTLAAWDATVARNNTDEIPPTIGSTADGLVQVTSAASNPDYVEIPMTTYALAAGETISGARMLAPGWAATTVAATIGFRSWNGTTETTLFAAADPNFDNSTTVPAWVCKMLTLADIDTQTELDALAFRVGFSTDASPVIGIHAIYAEVAIKASTGVPARPPTFFSQYAGRW